MEATETHTSSPRLTGVVGFFNDPETLLTATSQVRDARYERFDAFTPFPVHGLDDAMGLRPSPIPYITFVAGLTGCTLGFLFQFWTSAIDWPINIGGKPFNSWPAFVPVMFELTILFAGLSTFGAMLFFNGLPNITRKAFDTGITRDRFAILIEAPLGIEDEDEEATAKQSKYKTFSEGEATEFLKRLGATEVRSVYAEGWF